VVKDVGLEIIHRPSGRNWSAGRRREGLGGSTSAPIANPSEARDGAEEEDESFLFWLLLLRVDIVVRDPKSELFGSKSGVPVR